MHETTTSRSTLSLRQMAPMLSRYNGSVVYKTPQNCISCLQIFKEAIKAAILYKENSVDFLDQVMRELEVCMNLSPYS